MNNLKSNLIGENQKLCKKLVYAINKAITQDVPQNIQENHLETNNRNIFASIDFINDNLRRYVVDADTELHPFNRYAWEGRIIIDQQNKITYTISTHKNLEAVIRKHRSRPHFLMTLLYMENGDCEGLPKQISLQDLYPEISISSFESDVFEEDFNRIMRGRISGKEGYKHYIVAYTAENHIIEEIEILLLDKDFSIIDRLDLMKYVGPDFADLTSAEYGEINAEGTAKEKKPMLVRLKTEPKTALKSAE